MYYYNKYVLYFFIFKKNKKDINLHDDIFRLRWKILLFNEIDPLISLL